ncbi:MAG: aspartate-semialdehyde dehydrogenase [Acutalibacteraceae bacterium]|nr:aspartate-semialdehyde dehydrogenase [Acutalibacteraceae bacterium]
MKKCNIAILGATGAVGREMIKVLQERNFPVGTVKLLASARSVGKEIAFGDKIIKVEEAKADSFEGIDIVLGAASNALAKELAPHIKAAGAVFVDNSSAFRMEKDVPLVIPEINPEDVKKHNGIISNPNCSTIITLTAVNAINQASPIKSMIASTYQAVSGAGAGGPVELLNQTEAIYKGEDVKNEVFAHQIAYNLIPKIGGVANEGYTSEEMKMQNEGAKIMHLPDLKVSCTCIRVPVLRSHSISVLVKTEEPVSVEKAIELISNAPGCRYVEDMANEIYPMPLETSDQDIVFVGRIRPDLTDENGLNIWCCGDQVRKGAATNAIQIAELLLED